MIGISPAHTEIERSPLKDSNNRASGEKRSKINGVAQRGTSNKGDNGYEQGQFKPSTNDYR